MKTYSTIGFEIGKPAVVWVQPEGGAAYQLPPRHDLYNHSPDGFAWGYMGSGPSQLALAILADAFDDAYALANYQEFKISTISKLEQDEGWKLEEGEIRATMNKIDSQGLHALNGR